MKCPDFRTSSLICVLAILLYQPVVAQDMYGFYGDPCSVGLSNQLNAQMQHNQAMIEQTLQDYERRNAKELRAKYQDILSKGLQIPYGTFVYNDLMSSGGRNPQAVIGQRQGMVGAMQRANHEQQRTIDEYVRSWQRNQRTMDGVQQRGIDAIKGETRYYKPGTHQTFSLPYGPWGYEGGYFSDGTGSYVQTPGGQVYEIGPGGMGERLEPMARPAGEPLRQFFGESEMSGGWSE